MSLDTLEARKTFGQLKDAPLLACPCDLQNSRHKEKHKKNFRKKIYKARAPQLKAGAPGTRGYRGKARPLCP